MATLTVVDLTEAGVDPGYVAADVAGDEFPIADGYELHVRNESAGSITATVASEVAAAPGIAPAGLAVVVPAGETRVVRFDHASRFRDSATGRATVTCSAVASVEVAVVR